MSRRAATLLVVAQAMLATACGPGSYAELRDQLVDASCTWARRCGRAGAAERSACPVDEVLAIFHDTGAERATEHAIDVAGSVAAARRRYDAVNAITCLEAVAGASCDPQRAARAIRAACNAVVTPRTERDEPCWDDLDCTGGRCPRAPGCAGTCASYASPGAACVDDELGPQATHCDPTTAYCGPAAPGESSRCQRKHAREEACGDSRECVYDLTCRRGRCVAPIVLSEGESCGGSDPCHGGLYCDPGSRVCTGQRGRNLACTSRLGCEDGLACLGLVEDEAGSGGPLHEGMCADWLELGSACVAHGLSGCPTDSMACEGGSCRPRLASCDPSPCSNGPTPGGLGESCADRPCAAGLGCDERLRCGWLLPSFGDCAGERAPLCAPGLVCATTGLDSVVRPGRCLPADAPACFLAASLP